MDETWQKLSSCPCQLIAFLRGSLSLNLNANVVKEQMSVLFPDFGVCNVRLCDLFL